MKKRSTLKRERVNRALENIFHYPLTVVEAPIGYGKTTAVREFLVAKCCPLLWLSFLPTEDRAAFFWDRLADEFGRLDMAAGSRLKSLGFPSEAPQVATALSILSEIKYPENTVVVLDDFHLISGIKTGGLLKQLVMEEVDNLFIVVITRDTTNIDIAELTAKGLCTLLPQQILRFTDKEIRAYCTLTGLKINREELSKITEYTGGWISLIYLILLGVQQGIPIGRNSAIDDLVEKVLYNAYEPDVQTFLLRLSVMDGFTLEQAQFVTRESRAEEIIKRLRRENAFIGYDETAGSYTIHNVLLDYLRTKLTDQEELAALYQRLGEWHTAKKAHVLACTCLYRAGKTEHILALMDNTDTIMHHTTLFEGIFELFSSAPGELLLRYPIAYLRYIAILLSAGRQEFTANGMACLHALRKHYEERNDLDPAYKKHILAETYLVQGFSALNDISKMMACTQKAHRLLRGETSWLIQRENTFTLGLPHYLYIYYTAAGKLKETAALIADEFPAYSLSGKGYGTGCEYVTLAEYALETGDWQGAELNAFKGFHKAKTMNQTGLVICANLTLIRLYLFQGKIAEGMELLHQLHGYVAEKNSSIHNTTMDMADGYIYGLLGRYDSIPKWLQTGDMDSGTFLYRGMGFPYIVYGRAILLSKDYVRLEAMAEIFAQHFSAYNNQLGFLHNMIFEAVAKYRLYGMEAGCAALKKALDATREDHILLPFAEYAPHILDMVRVISHSDMRNGHVREVLAVCEQYIDSLKLAPQSAVSLSERELEVLTLAAEGLKRDEIAAKLYVSSGTVQVHLHNIYGKLEVNGRAAAVKKAQALKIL